MIIIAVVKNLLIRAGLDFSELNTELKKMQKTLNSAGKEITAVGKGLTLGLTVPIVGIAAASVKLASDLKEVQNVIDTAFGDSAKEVDKWAKTAISSYGLSELQAKQFAGTMRAMAGSMGLSADEADKMSMGLAGLAGDMASFYNLDPEEAFNKLRSGISGEVEPLRQLGINMSVANLEAYALSKGINTSWKEMSAAEQATLRYGYIMDATKNAQGDFAKTNDGFANSMRVVKEQLKVIGAQIGTVLLPFLEKALGTFRDWLTALQNMNPETLKTIMVIAGIAAAIGPLLLVVGKMLAMGAAIIGWAKGINLALLAVSAGTKGVGAIFTAVFGPAGIVLLIIAGIAALVAGFMWLWKNNEDFKNFFINTWNSIVAFMTPILETLKQYLVTAFQFIKDNIVAFIDNNKATIQAGWEFIKTLTIFIFDAIKTYFQVWITVIKAIFDTVTTALKWVWANFGDEIMEKISNVWEMIKGVFQGASQVLQGIFQTLTGLLTGNWSKCWEGMKNVVSGVWGMITSMVKGGVNAIISSLNVFIRGVNKIKVPSWVPLVGGKQLSIPEIPMLAKGTDYFKGGLAIVGECLPTQNRVKSVKSKLILWMKNKVYGIIDMWDRLGVINLIDKERQTLLPI